MSALTQEFLNGFVRRYAKAWTKKESAEYPLKSLITEDVRWGDPMLPQPSHGAAAALALCEASFTAFPDLTCDVMDPPYLSLSISTTASGTRRVNGEACWCA